MAGCLGMLSIAALLVLHWRSLERSLDHRPRALRGVRSALRVSLRAAYDDPALGSEGLSDPRRALASREPASDAGSRAVPEAGLEPLGSQVTTRLFRRLVCHRVSPRAKGWPPGANAGPWSSVVCPCMSRTGIEVESVWRECLYLWYTNHR